SCRLTSLAARFCFLFFMQTATTEIYTLSLHDALPIYARQRGQVGQRLLEEVVAVAEGFGEEHLLRQEAVQQRDPRHRGCGHQRQDRKSTRLNSSHVKISYAVFCLKKKKKKVKQK